MKQIFNCFILILNTAFGAASEQAFLHDPSTKPLAMELAKDPAFNSIFPISIVHLDNMYSQTATVIDTHKILTAAHGFMVMKKALNNISFKDDFVFAQLDAIILINNVVIPKCSVGIPKTYYEYAIQTLDFASFIAEKGDAMKYLSTLKDDYAIVYFSDFSLNFPSLERTGNFERFLSQDDNLLISCGFLFDDEKKKMIKQAVYLSTIFPAHPLLIHTAKIKPADPTKPFLHCTAGGFSGSPLILITKDSIQIVGLFVTGSRGNAVSFKASTGTIDNTNINIICPIRDVKDRSISDFLPEFKKLVEMITSMSAS